MMALFPALAPSTRQARLGREGAAYVVFLFGAPLRCAPAYGSAELFFVYDSYGTTSQPSVAVLPRLNAQVVP